MTPTEGPALLVCARCGVALEVCAFCEREDCREAICYRCLRLRLGWPISQPHAHGG